MTGATQPDPDLERTLRRVADHLGQRGSQYREQPVVEPSLRFGSPTHRTRAGLLAVAATIAAAVLGGTMLAQSADPSTQRQRLQAATDSEPSTTEVATDTVPRDGLTPGEPVGGDGAGGVTPGVIEPTLPGDTRPLDPTPPPDPIDGGTGGEGPSILDVVVPSTVSAGSSITFRWRVADPDSVSATGVVLGWVNGIYTPCGFGDVGSLTSGTLLDGEWSYTCTIPANAVATTYSVDVWASDGLGHSSRSTGFEFVVTGGDADASPPTYSNVRVVSGASVGDVLTVTWILNDPSGIEGAVMWIAGPSGGFTNLDTSKPYAMYDTLSVTRECNGAGDSCEFTQTVRIDPTSPAGAYALWISATDRLGNKVLNEVFGFTVGA